MNQLIQNAFSEPRKEGDPDLVADITNVLATAGHPNPTAWQADPLIQEAQPPSSPKYQLFCINRYWRMRLGDLPSSTKAERFCLDDKVEDYKEVVKIFGEMVAPRIVKEGL